MRAVKVEGTVVWVQEQETWGPVKELQTFLFSALQGGQWSASSHGCFTTN
jgi:hypothetical protein